VFVLYKQKSFLPRGFCFYFKTEPVEPRSSAALIRLNSSTGVSRTASLKIGTTDFLAWRPPLHAAVHHLAKPRHPLGLAAQGSFIGIKRRFVYK